MDSKYNKYAGLLIPLFLLVIIVSNSFFIVKSGETGLVSTFGKVSEKYRKEGLNFVIPFIQTPLIYSNRTQAKTFMTEAYSSDLQTMKVGMKVLYNLPAENVYTLATKYKGDVVNEFLRPRVEDEIKNVASKYKAEEFVKSRQETRGSSRGD